VGEAHIHDMRFGIFLGFLIGAAVASFLTSTELGAPAEEGGSQGGGLIDKLKRQAEEARNAARQASEEKQAEMLRDWEHARHQDA
jgi:hypothetical protein